MSRTVERDTIVKQGSTHTLHLEVNGDLTDATSIIWQARRTPSAAVGLTKAATLLSAAPHLSVVEVVLGPAETSTGGWWLFDLSTMVAGQPYRFPSDGYLRLRVIP